MDKKIPQIVSVLTGLKRYEWSKVKVAVEKVFDSASCKLELNDTESLRRMLELECNGKITPQQFES